MPWRFNRYGKHQVNICDRWNQNKAGLATTALFNGIGMESWENVWGTWNGMTPRDSALYTRMGALLRFAGGHTYGGSAQHDANSTRALFQAKGWLPFSPIVTTPPTTFASTFPADDGTETLVTVVSFSAGAVATLTLDAKYATGYSVYDVWHGVPLKGRMVNGAFAVNAPLDDSLLQTNAQTNASTPAGGGGGGDANSAGYGAVLLTKKGANASLTRFLQRMKELTAKDLAKFSCEGGIKCSSGSADWPFYPSCNTTKYARGMHGMAWYGMV